MPKIPDMALERRRIFQATTVDDKMLSVKPPTGWVRRSVRIKTHDGVNKDPLPSDQFSKDKVDAWCMGEFAVHKAYLRDDDAWSVTHIATGYLISSVKKVDDAFKIANFLWSKFCLPFRETDYMKVLEKLPDWVGFWVRDCRKAEAWIDADGYAKKQA